MKTQHIYGSLLAALILTAQGCGGGNSGDAAAAPTNAAVVVDVPAPSPSPAASGEPAAATDLAKPLTATFAKPPDPATVTPQSAYLITAEGEPVAGTLAIYETSIVFTPQTSLRLVTTYTFVLTPALKDVSGAPLLTEEKRVRFTTRDGQWQAPQTLMADLNHRNLPWPPGLDLDPQGNAVVAVAQQKEEANYPTDILARRFDRLSNAWSEITLLANRQDANVGYLNTRAAPNGDFAVYWLDYIRREAGTPYGFAPGSIWGARYLNNQGGWRLAQQWAGDFTYTLCCAFQTVAFTPDGNGWFVWRAVDAMMGGNTQKVQATQLLADGTFGSTSTLGQNNFFTDPAAGTEKTNIRLPDFPVAIDGQGRATVSHVTTDTVFDPATQTNGPERCYINRYSPGTGWSAREQVQDAGFPNSCSVTDLRSNKKGQILTRTLPPSGEKVDPLDLSVTQVWANMYDPQLGWTGSVRLNIADPNEDGPPVMMDIDEAGNAMVLWVGYGYADPAENGPRYVRYEPGTGWTKPQRLDVYSTLPAGYEQNYCTHFELDAQGNGIAVFQLFNSSVTPGILSGFAVLRYIKGQGWSKPQLIPTTELAFVRYLRLIGIDDAGRAMLAWTEKQPDGKWRVQLTRFE
jgi:hypothetical protein